MVPELPCDWCAGFQSIPATKTCHALGCARGCFGSRVLSCRCRRWMCIRIRGQPGPGPGPPGPPGLLGVQAQPAIPTPRSFVVPPPRNVHPTDGLSPHPTSSYSTPTPKNPTGATETREALYPPVEDLRCRSSAVPKENACNASLEMLACPCNGCFQVHSGMAAAQRPDAEIVGRWEFLDTFSG